jgi:hypothetical protein
MFPENGDAISAPLANAVAIYEVRSNDVSLSLRICWFMLAHVGSCWLMLAHVGSCGDATRDVPLMLGLPIDTRCRVSMCAAKL